MVQLHRNTAFTTEELLNFLSNGSHHRECLLLNEVGNICATTKDKDGQAEKYLISILEEENPSKRSIAFFYLSYNKTVAERNSDVLAEFRSKPENDEIVVLVDDKLKTD